MQKLKHISTLFYKNFILNILINIIDYLTYIGFYLIIFIFYQLLENHSNKNYWLKYIFFTAEVYKQLHRSHKYCQFYKT